MSNKRQQLARRRDQVGKSATPINIQTDHLTPVQERPRDTPEDVLAFWVPLTDLHGSPHQYRYAPADAAIDALATSIASGELYQPITVRPRPGQSGQYEVVLGHRRLEAFRRLGAPAIPAIIREYDDAQALRAMLDENLRREDVNLFEQTEGAVRLIALTAGRSGDPVTVTRELLKAMRAAQYAQGHDEFSEEPYRSVAQLIQEVTGMTWASFAANRMRVYSLPAALQDEVRGGMPYSLALAVQRLPAALQAPAVTYLRTPDGWRTRQDLQVWTDQHLQPARPNLSQRFGRVSQALARQHLSAEDEQELQALLQLLEQRLGLHPDPL